MHSSTPSLVGKRSRRSIYVRIMNTNYSNGSGYGSCRALCAHTGADVLRPDPKCKWNNCRGHEVKYRQFDLARYWDRQAIPSHATNAEKHDGATNLKLISALISFGLSHCMSSLRYHRSMAVVDYIHSPRAFGRSSGKASETSVSLDRASHLRRPYLQTPVACITWKMSSKREREASKKGYQSAVWPALTPV